ncbi:MAG: hypothetical protein ACR2Q4_20900 [Geminicoccaceae bacterium]
MKRRAILVTALLALAGCATPLERSTEDGWTVLSQAELIALHSAGLVLEGPGWTVSYTGDGRKVVNSEAAVKELSWEVREGKFCQELYRTDYWDCGDISIIARKADKIRYFNHSGSVRDEGTIVEGG